MKSIFFFIASLFILNNSNAQNIKGLLNKAKDAVAGKPVVLGNDEIIAGLKEALTVGTEKGTAMLSKENGFFGNELLKIVLPPEAQKVEKTLRSVGFGKQVDDAILTMNRGAEEACKEAAPIFVNAIKKMTVQDAVGILKGADTAATGYLRSNTTAALTTAFKPIIDGALEKVGATKYWSTMVTTYNKFSMQKINPDLSTYVTERALQGVFTQIAVEEKNIRKDPVARTSELLKKVFAN
jgi:hypothetical protein